MNRLNSPFLRRIGAALPLLLLLAYGLLVSSPKGEAGGGNSLRVTIDPRLELAGIVGRLATDSAPAWPDNPALVTAVPRLNDAANHPAVERVRRWVRHGFTPELLAALLMQREPLPGLGSGRKPGAPAPPLAPATLGSLPGAHEFDAEAAGCSAAALDSLALELRDFASVIAFDDLWRSAEPLLTQHAKEIEGDPTFRNLTARLSDFFGESPVSRAIVAPTLYGAWRSPFAFNGPAEGQVTVVDRAPGGRLVPENSLSWACAREFARPLIQRITSGNAARVAGLAGYWDYFRQGVAATTLTGWEDCLNAHLFRAIDLRVRPQDDAVERELRISTALEAGMGMIRAVDGAVAGYDRSRGFYRRFADYFPTLLDDLTGLDARIRVERPRLGLKTSSTPRGLRITEITPGFSAEASGLLRVGDVIVAGEGKPARSEEFLASLVQSRRLGDAMNLAIEREGAPLNLAVVLSKGKVEYEFFKRPALPVATPNTPPADPVGR